MKKYEVQGVIGMGAYGVVLKAYNKQTKEPVAIKKFKESDQNPIIKKIALREVKALKNLKNENIVKFKEAFRRDKKLNIVFEFVEKTVLEDIERSSDGLGKKLIKSYIYQILKGLRYLHSLGIIHRDIKPENLLVDEKGVLKLCDFGFARKINKNDIFLTDYVATRWYRSPSLILTNRYSFPVDIWAVGCIMGELIDGQPMFPGDNSLDQIYHIVSVLGKFNKKLLDLFMENRDFKNVKFPNVVNPEGLGRKYGGLMDKKGLDLLKGLLEMDDKKRLTAEEALKHEYFSDLLKEDKELFKELFSKKNERSKNTENKENIRRATVNKEKKPEESSKFKYLRFQKDVKSVEPKREFSNTGHLLAKNKNNEVNNHKLIMTKTNYFRGVCK